MTTKWDLITDKERATLERTPCGRRCAACNTLLPTEADFAKHFVLYQNQYLNLGWCPIKHETRPNNHF